MAEKINKPKSWDEWEARPSHDRFEETREDNIESAHDAALAEWVNREMQAQLLELLK